MKNAGVYAMVLGSFLFLSACDFQGDREPIGPTAELPVSIDGGGADRANVELDMRVGEMRVSGGGTKLLEGNIEYNVPRWKPEITSSKNGVHATVTVRQPEGGGGGNLGNRRKNTWELHLANKTLLDLAVNCGVGQFRLDLGDVLLRSVQVHMGVGQVDLNLDGKPQHDYDVTIEGGIGQANVHLPHDVGIYATAHGGIGNINVTGLHKEGDHWENDLYDKAKVNVRIDAKGGIGEIKLIG